MKKISIFILIICFIIPIFSFFGCTPLYENAICKIGKKEYSSLAQAIVECQEGQTIEVYNDVKENLNNNLFIDNTFIATSANNNVYVNYIIDKAITIKGIKQNYKQPKIYGSFVTELSSLESLDKSITITNVEIINDHVSLTDDNLNKPFVNAVTIKDGSITIKNCVIKQSVKIDNSIIEENNLSCFNGIILSRKQNSVLSGQTLSYFIRENEFYGYTNYTTTQTSSALSVLSNYSDFGSIYPCTINGQEKDFFKNLEYENTISPNNAIIIQNFDFLTQKYSYLRTYNPNLIKPENFEENCTIQFLGKNFGFETKTDFEVYGHLSFKNVKNINFIMKTTTAKITIEGSRNNISVVPYAPIP